MADNKPKKRPDPFEDIDQIAKPKVELKAQGKSMFDDQPKKPSPEQFKQQASAVNDKLNSYNVRAVEAVTAFMKLLEDQTIPKNKSVFAADVEQEIINKFQRIALDMDADEHQPEGMGSVGVITFLLKVSLIQRDKINQLDYNINLLNAQIKETALQSIDKKPQEK